MQAGRKWRRTAVELSGRLVPLRDDWSLHDASSDIELARISWTPDSIWHCAVRTIRENELTDESMGWIKTVPEAEAYCES
jgi:hypothetical protein